MFQSICKRDKHICFDKEDTDGCRQIGLVQDGCSHSKNLSVVSTLAHAKDGQNVFPLLFIFFP